jgi:hypothetical protein
MQSLPFFGHFLGFLISHSHICVWYRGINRLSQKWPENSKLGMRVCVFCLLAGHHSRKRFVCMYLHTISVCVCIYVYLQAWTAWCAVFLCISYQMLVTKKY